jgi:16S rRNA (adenine1518-N6/adenine1519-N6)-dimethyltransferase
MAENGSGRMDTPISVKAIREVLGRWGYAPRKSLGQNFLIDKNILAKIANSGNLDPGDLVLEVGPGLGALTGILAEQAGRVVAVEYDRGLFSILQEYFATTGNLTLINQDIMDTDLWSVIKDIPTGVNRYKVIANLPYYITTPVIFKLVESQIPWELMVFLVQKEVAQRIVAGPGNKEYGALTVMLNFYGQVEKVGSIPRTVFYPAPDVDSAIIRIIPHQAQEIQEVYPCMRRVVQAAFGQRRKKILNALEPLEELGNKAALAGLLAGLGIDPERRGEELSVPEFFKIAREIRLKVIEGVLK